ncbi:MAG: hypothetical protein OXE94_03810 [Aestuariivita sp.]|nr:hypothetical protein [Aestuariivita sp.]MCY4201694.1 hypothetical protein [Aestuariivita sp.]
MRPEQLAESYPRLFHMAWQGSWENIRKYGLLSTQALVELYKLSPEQGGLLLQNHRPEWVEISCAGLGTATVRDQKPMSDKGVCTALGVNDPRPWYELLNSMVFFWPTKERLRTMMSAKAYIGMKHDLLVVDTKKLVDRHCDNIRLSRMNSGATKPFSHPRDLNLFKTFEEFPFGDRRKRCGVKKAVAEVCVLNSVRDIKDLVVDVRTVTLDDIEF